MADSWHVKWLAEGVRKWNARRKRIDFVPDLSGIRFFEHLPSDFRDEPKTSRTFENINLKNANLIDSDLSNSNFYNADFTGANLSGANLSKSNFEKAKFIRSNLSEAQAEGSFFDGAKFQEAHLAGLQFGNAEIGAAVFINSTISESQRLTLRAQNAKIYSTLSAYKEDTERAKFPKSNGMAKADIPKSLDEKSRKAIYDVYFGTNRMPVYERGALVDFDGNTSPQINVGLCEVIIPENTPIEPRGSLGSRLWRLLNNKKKADLDIQNLISLNEELFWEQLIKTSEKMKVQARPTIFVHGYRTSFTDAVLRAAQVGYGLGIGQGIGLFSWPSKGKIRNYLADEASVEKSKYALAEFIERYVDYSNEQGINIIAHSMGCRCLLGALEQLAHRNPKALGEVKQIILAAADVDTGVMPHLAPYAISIADRTTSYVSNRDKPLELSGILHSFPRVGFTPPTYVFDGMDTIVINDLEPVDFMAHAYVATNRLVLSDIYAILKNNLPPSSRHGLDAETGPQGIQYWKFRK